MIVKMKCVFLKKDVDPKILEDYGFVPISSREAYYASLASSRYIEIRWYAETRRFVLKYPVEKRAKIVKRYLGDLFQKGIVEIKPFYECLCLIGDWRNWSYEKRERIERKLRKLNGMEELK